MLFDKFLSKSDALEDISTSRIHYIAAAAMLIAFKMNRADHTLTTVAKILFFFLLSTEYYTNIFTDVIQTNTERQTFVFG